MDRKEVEFLLKLRDGHLMIAEAINERIECLAPQEVKEHVNENVFLSLKFEPQQGAKLGIFEVAYKANNEEPTDKWTKAYDVLSKSNASIKDRYHAKDYQFSYWLYGEGKIYRQKLKKGEEPPRPAASS